jgi:ATP-dependent exoDNAse (exonuclease V) beta subunit
VQALAGSGKTELLTQRFLALLARVEQPEAVVAITFTRKAAGEMRARLLAALEMAHGPGPAEAHKRETWSLAAAVNRRDWGLIDNPARLRIQTFDSFCRSLAEQMPWLSRLGAAPRIADDTEALYYTAALEAVRAVEQGDPAVTRLLAHLDNQFSRVAEKLAEMLARRDQWLRHLHIDRAGVERALRAVSRLALRATGGRRAQHHRGRLARCTGRRAHPVRCRQPQMGQGLRRLPGVRSSPRETAAAHGAHRRAVGDYRVHP